MEFRDQQREEMLQAEISKLVRQKWIVISQSRFNAQLEKYQVTLGQSLMIIGGLLMAVVPGLIVAAVVGKGKRFNMFVEVTQDLKVKKRKQ